jgi:hypothetical protein
VTPRARSLAALTAGVAACAAAGACGSVPAGNPLPDVEAVDSAVGVRYRVVCHFPCGGAAAEAAGVADLAWRGAAELLGLESAEGGDAAGADSADGAGDGRSRAPATGGGGRVSAPTTGAGDTRDLPTIRLYRAEAFLEVARSLARDHLEEGGAFTSPQRRTAYVELIPPVGEESLRTRGLPAPTLRLVAHEAAHLAFAEAAGGAPRLPDWLSEGAALAVERDVARRGRLFAGTRDPRFAAQTWRTHSLLRTGRAPPLSEVLTEPPNVAADRAAFALRGLAFAFLRRERPRAWARLIQGAGRLLGDPGAADSLARIAAAELSDGAGEWAVDDDFRAYVRRAAADVGWLELRGLPRAGEEVPHAGLPRGRVTVLSGDPWRGAAIAITGHLEFAPASAGAGSAGAAPMRRMAPGAAGGDAPGMALVLAGVARRRLVVSFDPDGGRVEVLAATAIAGRGPPGESLAQASIGLPPSFDFEVRLRPDASAGGSMLEVWVDGARVLGVPVEVPDARGDWGVAAEPGAAGVWRGLAAAEPG